MEIRWFRESGSNWAKPLSGKPTPYLRCGIRWMLSVFGPVLIVWSLAATCAFGQTAQVSGVITDSTGAVVPKAGVTALNKDNGVNRATESNNVGYYTIPLLQPGNYMITVKAIGFTTQVRTGITLDVGDQQVLDFKMQVGQVTQTVVVTGEAPTVQLTSSTLSAVVNATTVRELPLNGRSWTDLAALQPGVSAIQTQFSFTSGSGRGNRGFGDQVSVSGARPQQNNYRLDGVSLNDYANGAPGSVLGGNLGVDAIQEFSVLTSNYSAEYGKTSGGVINAITRSGTNQFHGSAYEFLRNSSLDARNFFDGPKIPPFKRNQFGASAGGPIRKDRTFVFGDFEGVRQSLGITNVDTVPSPAARAGTFGYDPTVAPPTQCTVTVPGTCTLTVDPSVQKYLPFWPLPNGGPQPGTFGNIGIFNFAGQQVINENFFTIRVDHKISEKESLFATYLYDAAPFSAPDNLNDVILGSNTNRQIVVLEENHTFSSTLINSVRFGFNRESVANNQGLKAVNPAAADPSLSAVPGALAAGINVSGISPFLGGLGGSSPWRYAWNSFQAYDDAFLTKGLHALKFGIAFERMQMNMIAFSDQTGSFHFGSLQDFLTNKPQRFIAAFPGLLSPRGLRQSLFGAYVQDDWRWRPNLTVNLGLRYEMTTVPTEVQNKLSTLINITDAQPHLGSPFFLNPTLRNFEPRVGFAWDPFSNGKTSVRGGWGMFDVLPLPYEVALLTNRSAPFSLTGTASNLPAGTFFAGAFPLLGKSSVAETYIEHSPHRNYVMQWNMNVQRELLPSLTAMIGYVGSHGVHQPFRVDDSNLVIPTLTSAGYLWPSPVASGTNLNPNFGQMRSLMWAGSSVYHALQLALVRRMSHGLQLQGSYTWGKSIDTSSAAIAGDQFGNSISSLDWFDLKLSRAPSDFNVGRTLVIEGTWDLPAFKSVSGLAGRIVNGWELGGVYKVSDGVPFTATFGTDGDPLGTNSSDPFDFPNRLTGPGCKSLVNPGNPNNYIKTQCFAIPSAPNMAFWTANCDPTPFTDANGNKVAVPFPQCFNLRGNAGRNILTGPGTMNLDFSVFKNNYIKRISENFNVQFRMEFFNILNRANFAVPVTPNNTDIFDSTGAPTGVAGLLTSTTTTAREIQFAVKLVW
jgi:hypothetical protein